MGPLRRLFSIKFLLDDGLIKRNFHDVRGHLRNRKARAAALLGVGGVAAYSLFKLASTSDYTVHAFKKAIKKEDEPPAREVRLTSRERRFLKFASAMYDGQIYMTPRDFLESFIHEEPIPVREKRDLSKKDLEGMGKSTPSLNSGSSHMFRNLKDNGIISYTEYLFLLSILTKPLSGFRIAFNMFDTDGNERVDKNEFLVLQRIFGKKRFDDEEEKLLLEKIFSHAWKDKRGMEDIGDMLHVQGSAVADYVDDDMGLQRRHSVDTTLAVHFFGVKGNQDLKYEGFRKFMDDLQTEVLEIEFNEFSNGKETISEVDFAKILLRYTHLSPEAHTQYLERLVTRVKDSMKGITFNEFKIFCQFLNNLEDFTIAMRMYTLADHPISKDEFHRAVMICTGTSMSRHLVQTVFAIFDEDGDGQLSYREFIAIMKDRLHRGFKTSIKKAEGWDSFKLCLKQELKTPL